MQPGPDPHEPPLPRWRLAAALFALSFATVLFTIVLFRLLSFFIMPSLFFDLLFIGFPLGALVGAYRFRIARRAFLRSLWILQGAMLASIGAMLVCKHFDYLRAHLFDVELQRLFIQMLAFTGFFLPFFAAYGLSEYLGYQVGRRALRGHMPVVYALYLFGAAAAYVFAEYAFPLLGAGRLLLIPFLLVALSMVALVPPGRLRGVLLAEQLVLLALMSFPRLEGVFLDLYKGASMQSTHAYAQKGFDTVFQRWGRYSLVEVMQAPGTEFYAGFYNDIIQWHYSPWFGYARRALGMIPIEHTPPGARIAIIGSGGGRQVQYAKRAGRDIERITAIEIEPAVLEAVRGPLAERFDHVYEGDQVRAIRHEARSYMEHTHRRFDLIYLPSVGGYPQMMLEPGNMIRTQDAFRTLRERLTERGVLAVWYPAVLDPKGVLTEQYIRTLDGPALDLAVRAFRNDRELLILAARDIDHLPDLSQVQAFFMKPPTARLPFPPDFMAVPVEMEAPEQDASFRPITDQQPFLAGNVRNIFSPRQVGILFALVAGLLVVFAALLLALVRRRGAPGIPGRSLSQVMLVSLVVGANFLVMEHYLILSLFQRLYVYHDALVLGAIGFLIITGLGSMLVSPRWRPACQALAGALLLILAFHHTSLPPWAALGLLAPVAFVTGSFFPALFEAAADNPLGVFAADAVGSAIGAMASFFIPIVLGFDWLYGFATVWFLITALGVYLFFRGLAPDRAASQPLSAPAAAR